MWYISEEIFMKYQKFQIQQIGSTIFKYKNLNILSDLIQNIGFSNESILNYMRSDCYDLDYIDKEKIIFDFNICSDITRPHFFNKCFIFDYRHCRTSLSCEFDSYYFYEFDYLSKTESYDFLDILEKFPIQCNRDCLLEILVLLYSFEIKMS